MQSCQTWWETTCISTSIAGDTPARGTGHRWSALERGVHRRRILLAESRGQVVQLRGRNTGFRIADPVFGRDIAEGNPARLGAFLRAGYVVGERIAQSPGARTPFRYDARIQTRNCEGEPV